MFDENEDEGHVPLAKAALRSSRRLNNWEIDFCTTLMYLKYPSPKQLATLDAILAKSKAKMPGPSRRKTCSVYRRAAR